ncbi:putative CAAX prenyl protease 2 [Pseudocercospora fuligena]|uniref:intramembrane prenyl-peptidase Rce1 n=1 Tax=Pseudocercospora fuligena TaxID=685502 RepID=A0A8H6R9R7_9PEZI|nr:putative CAAX prenyl protease 2 [Pseudocercospora fuligena]
MAPPGRMDKVWQGSSQLFGRLRDYYFGKKGELLSPTAHLGMDDTPHWQQQRLHQRSAEAPPLISERTAVLFGLLFTLIFIAPFYLSPTLRTSSLQSRDAPTVIKARIRAVGLSCVASTVVAVYVLVVYGHATARDVLRLLAVWPVNLIDCGRVLTLVAVLFVGPLYETVIVDSGWREWRPRAIKEKFFDSLPGLRNNVVAPLAEEWVFRSLVVSLYLLAKVPAKRIVFTSPLIFGAAHIHHLVEVLRTHTPPGRLLPPLNVWIRGILQSLFQFTYTSLFGFFTAFVYLRTGNLYAVVLAHSFCNVMSLPRVYGRLGQDEDDELYEMTPDVAQGKRDDGLASMKDRGQHNPTAKNLGIQWTILYYILLPSGAYGFYRLLWPMTESTNALAGFVRP